MDFTLPDGTVVTGIPQGTTPSQIYSTMRSKGYDLSGLQNQTYNVGESGLGEAAQQLGAGMTTPQKIGAGVTESLNRTAGGTILPLMRAYQEPTPFADQFTDSSGGDSSPQQPPPDDAQGRDVLKNVVEGAGTPAKAASIATDVGLAAATLPFAEARGAQLIGELAPSMAGKVLPKALASIGSQAGLAAAQSPDDPTSAALWGAGGAAAAPLLQGALAGPLRGLVSTNAQRLAESGVSPTLGQSMARSAADLPVGAPLAGLRGFVGRMIGGAEDLGTSVPGLGGGIEATREAAANQFSEGAIRNVLPKGAGDIASGDVGDMLADARSKVGDMYNAELEGKTIGGGTSPMTQAYSDVADNPDHFLTDAQKTQLDNHVDNKILSRFDADGQMPGQLAQQINSDLGRQVTRYRGSQSAEERNFGNALDDIHQAWRDQMRSQLGPDAAANLSSADAAYRRLITAERAAGTSRGIDAAQITPANLESAIVAMRQRAPSGAKIIGANEPLADYARAGQILRSRTPNSGTAERLGAGAVLGGALLGTPSAEGEEKQNMYIKYGLPMLAARYGYRPLGRALMGQTGLQQRIAPAIFRQALSAGITPIAARMARNQDTSGNQ